MTLWMLLNPPLLPLLYWPPSLCPRAVASNPSRRRLYCPQRACFTAHNGPHDTAHNKQQPMLYCPQVCVFTAPLFSAFCALACYGLVREVRPCAGTGSGAAGGRVAAVLLLRHLAQGQL